MTDATYPPHGYGLITPSRWAPGIWRRVFIASTLALGLQWGTAGAAVFIHYKSPPVGLGCRSLSFLLYAMTGTLSFFPLFGIEYPRSHVSAPARTDAYSVAVTYLLDCRGERLQMAREIYGDRLGGRNHADMFLHRHRCIRQLFL
ncbi:hypothetical protein BJ322DRAFT_254545 [Thelephora terrestris]|uniref:Uncharacterized protein n=1 Tax=Thelephora terrestris TaxID=56493 RepID=A0A9P6H9L1_9AGAM|nr:hypothetical protein BJ322DRAFT_254545 [Thelephora terrestris]